MNIGKYQKSLRQSLNQYYQNIVRKLRNIHFILVDTLDAFNIMKVWLEELKRLIIKTVLTLNLIFQTKSNLFLFF